MMKNQQADKDQLADSPAKGYEQSCLIAQTVLALAIIVIGIKTGKVLLAFLFNENVPFVFQTISTMMFSSVVVRLFAIFVFACGVGRMFRAPWRKQAAALSFLLVIGVWFIKDLTTGVQFFPIAHATEVYFLFSLFRMDLVFLGSFAIIVYFLVTLWPARYFHLLRLLLGALVCFLLLLSGLELASYCKTGDAGTGQMLGFFLSNFLTLWPLLRTQFDFVSLCSLVGPILIGATVAFGVGKWYGRPRQGESKESIAKAVPALLIVVLASALVHPSPHERFYDRFFDNTYLGLRDLIPGHRAAELGAIKRAAQLPVLADSSDITLRARGDAPSARRNVVIVILESTRANATTVYNSTLNTTPFLASFSGRGAVVANMYAAIPRTSAAWTEVLDGIWPSPDIDITAWARSGQVRLKSLPRLLATRGYASAYFTSAHLHWNYDEPLIKNMGFDQVSYADTLPNEGFEHPTFWGYEDRIMVQPALDWVKRQRDKNSPSLLVMMTNIGHYDYKYPSSWQRRSFEAGNTHYNDYLNCLSYVDSVMQDFINGLERLNVLSSSLVIILGDHGDSFGEHGEKARSNLVYEENVKIPAIVYAPGLIEAGTVIPGLRQQIDIFPTVFDVLGLELENSALPGKSLLRPADADRDLYFASELDRGSMALRRKGLKFIYNFDRYSTEVYAIDSDPSERHDIRGNVPPSEIEDAEMDMLIWHRRTQRMFTLSPQFPVR
jgi:lipoteichoic acid synthase